MAGQVQDVEAFPLQSRADLGKTAPVQHPHIRTLPGPCRVYGVQDPAQFPLVVEEFTPAGLRAGHHRQNPQRTRHLHRYRRTPAPHRAVQLHLLRQHQRPYRTRNSQGLPRQIHPPRVIHCQPDPQRRMTRLGQLLLPGQSCRHLTAYEPLTQRPTHGNQRPCHPSGSGCLLRGRRSPRGQAARGPGTGSLQRPQLLLKAAIHPARHTGRLAAHGGERHYPRADP
ncbi:hypothetical protein GCM10018980_27640 [Streptomyces capoamus]|uniref:Uncharacterized protein n=1 Tax=Streptomyces capoamus TaxID=68183 RepID=A0A919EWY9_9ACTN|nr:hypothetical protein GCM10018980_27640 [Streptomyces capoamus]